MTAPATPPRQDRHSPWFMLMALTTAFGLSQAFRTAPAILAPPLQAEFGLSAQALGLYAGAFHLAFGVLQLFMGIGIDLHGVRRTVLLAFPLAVAGALVSAAAPSFAVLVAGQVLIGIGCAPAFLVCTVFIARHFAPERFAAVSGLVMGIGSVGLLLTGTPLAALVEYSSWRIGFAALAVGAAGAWLAILLLVHEPAGGVPPPPASAGAALRGYGALFRLPHTAGILLLAFFTYAAFLSLRGLWLGPLLIERHGFSLVQSGHVALAVSVVGMAAPPLFGRLDPGVARRRGWIIGCTLLCAALFGAMALNLGAAADAAVAVAIGLASGFIILQYADVRAAYPASMTGRAMAVFTMAMFVGVAVVQWLTGAVASAALSAGLPPFGAVLATLALLLVAAGAAFRWLPAPPRLGSS